jgi:hypothetical protein
MAVKLRKPTYVFPVRCLETLTSIDKYRGEEPGRLRDCITLKPNTTVEHLYNIMLHYPLRLTAGDFIRAEVKFQDNFFYKIYFFGSLQGNLISGPAIKDCVMI